MIHTVVRAIDKLLAGSVAYLPKGIGRQIIKRLNSTSSYRISPQAEIFDLFFAIGKPSSDVRTVIDVGAHVGVFTKQLFYYYPSATIYSFEPQSRVFTDLVESLSQPPFTEALARGQIQLFTQGLSSEIAEADLFLLAHPDSSSLVPMSAERYKLAPDLYETVGTERVSLTTLDHFITSHSIGPIDILKIDVEGAYYDVLKGGQKTLKTTDAVFIEMDFVSKGRSSRDWIDAVSLLHDSGLYLTSLRAGGNGGEVFSIRAAYDFLVHGTPPSAAVTHVVECIFKRS